MMFAQLLFHHLLFDSSYTHRGKQIGTICPFRHKQALQLSIHTNTSVVRLGKDSMSALCLIRSGVCMCASLNVLIYSMCQAVPICQKTVPEICCLTRTHILIFGVCPETRVMLISDSDRGNGFLSVCRHTHTLKIRGQAFRSKAEQK